jgi:hypothetical protein
MKNESTEAMQPFQSRRRLKLIFVFGVLLSIWGGISLNERILHVKRFSQLTAFYKPNQAEQAFRASYPTDKEIEAYLTNATILVSDGGFYQAIYYFDEPHHFLQWRNDGSSNTALIAGEWFTKWYLLPMELNGRWRFARVYSFCWWFPSMNAELPQDSCSIVERLDFLFGASDATREYRLGNIFKLSAGGTAPFPLPNRTRLSIDGLVAMEKDQARTMGR